MSDPAEVEQARQELKTAKQREQACRCTAREAQEAFRRKRIGMAESSLKRAARTSDEGLITALEGKVTEAENALRDNDDPFLRSTHKALVEAVEQREAAEAHLAQLLKN